MTPRDRALRAKRWREARQEFFSNLSLSVAVMFLSLWRALEFDDWLTPLVLLVFSLAAIWLEERTFPRPAQCIVLTLAIVVQVMLYWEHFGALMGACVGALGATYVWRAEFLAWLRHQRGTQLGVPRETARATLVLAKGTKATLRRIRMRVHGKPRR